MIKIFEYLNELDCFILSPHYKSIAKMIGLGEWHEVVWIGRYFTLDNDYGEHWFDNWELREKIESKATELGIDSSDIFIIDPERFKNDKDGPSHTNEERKRFWTDVLMNLQLSYATFFAEAKRLNKAREALDNDEYIEDLEERIEKIKANINGEVI